MTLGSGLCPFQLRGGLPCARRGGAVRTRERGVHRGVRELEDALGSAVALSAEGTVDLAFLPEPSAPAPDVATGFKEQVAAFERRLILAALEAAGGNQSEAARALGLGRTTLHDKMQMLGLTRTSS